MTFHDLVKQKNDALAHEEVTRLSLAAAKAKAEEIIATANTAVALAGDVHAKAAEVVASAHEAIHNLLADRGQHYVVDPKDGTLWLYSAVDAAPGWAAYQPIPGTLPDKSEPEHAE